MPEWLDRIITNPVVGLVIPVITFLGGRWWGRRRSQREWASKSFMHRLTVSLNTFTQIGDRRLLTIRTILEDDLIDVLKNQVAVDELLAAAEKTTKEDPIIHLGADGWYILNAVLNEIAERFSAGEVAKCLGLPVEEQPFMLYLTCERSGGVRIQKIRAMLIRQDAHDEIDYLAPELRAVEHENHHTRWSTLTMAAGHIAKEDHMVMQIAMPCLPDLNVHIMNRGQLDAWWDKKQSVAPEHAIGRVARGAMEARKTRIGERP